MQFVIMLFCQITQKINTSNYSTEGMLVQKQKIRSNLLRTTSENYDVYDQTSS